MRVHLPASPVPIFEFEAIIRDGRVDLMYCLLSLFFVLVVYLLAQDKTVVKYNLAAAKSPKTLNYR